VLGPKSRNDKRGSATTARTLPPQKKFDSNARTVLGSNRARAEHRKSRLHEVHERASEQEVKRVDTAGEILLGRRRELRTRALFREKGRKGKERREKEQRGKVRREKNKEKVQREKNKEKK